MRTDMRVTRLEILFSGGKKTRLAERFEFELVERICGISILEKGTNRDAVDRARYGEAGGGHEDRHQGRQQDHAEQPAGGDGAPHQPDDSRRVDFVTGHKQAKLKTWCLDASLVW
eukprot:g66992.t1